MKTALLNKKLASLNRLGDKANSTAIKPNRKPSAKQKQDDPKGAVSVTCSALNVRAEASKESSRIGGLIKGQSVSYFEEKNGWLKIPYGTGYGWICAQYTTYKAPTSTTPDTGTTPTTPETPETPTTPTTPEPPAFTKFDVKVTPSEGLNVRTGPGTNNARIGGLNCGDQVTVIGEQNGWYQINFQGQTGWICAEYTSKVSGGGSTTTQPPAQTNKTVITTDGLNMRDKPGSGTTPASDSSVYLTIPAGTQLTVTAEQNGWYQVSYGGKTGWVCANWTSAYDPSAGSSAVSTNGVPLWCQGDPRWGSRQLGTTGANTIRSAGCAMCSTAMCLSKMANRDITPAELDQYLDTHGGYDGDCIYWDKAAKMIGKSASSGSQNKGTIDNNLNAGRPVVIGVKAGGHYVCVAGRNTDGKYVIHDPGDGTRRGGTWNGSAIKVDGYSTFWQLVHFY